MRGERIKAIATALSKFSEILPNIIIGFVGGLLILNGHATLGVVMAFMQLNHTDPALIRNGGDFFAEIRDVRVNLQRMYEIFVLP